jgi:proline iminopeptidase
MKISFFTGLMLLLAPGCKSQTAGPGNTDLPADTGKIAHIYYREIGAGTPVLLVNGGPGMNSEGFATLADLLSADHTVILFDQRGTGRSTLKTINEQTITMDAMADDMEQLRKQLGYTDWVVMGHSFGGMLASYYTAKHPEAVKGLILSSSGGTDLDLLTYINNSINGRLTPQQLDTLRYWNNRIYKGDTSYNARLRRAKALAPAYLEKKEFVPAVTERLMQADLRINELVFANMRKINFDCSEKLKLFHKPVLIIQGIQDVVKKETALKAKAVLPQADTVFIDQCSHYGWLEQKDIYIGALRSFLSKNKL